MRSTIVRFLADLGRLFLMTLPGTREIVRGLQIHPKLRRVPEVLRQQERRLGSDAALAAYHFIDPIEGNLERTRQGGLRQTAGKQEFLLQNRTWMSRNAKIWQHLFCPPGRSKRTLTFPRSRFRPDLLSLSDSRCSEPARSCHL